MLPTCSLRAPYYRLCIWMRHLHTHTHILMFRSTTSTTQARESLLPPIIDKPWFPRVEEEDGEAVLAALETAHRERKLALREKAAPKPIGLGLTISSNACTSGNTTRDNPNNHSISRSIMDQEDSSSFADNTNGRGSRSSNIMMQNLSPASSASQDDDMSASRQGARPRVGTADQMDFHENEEDFFPSSFVSIDGPRLNESASSVDISADVGGGSPRSNSPDDMFSYTYRGRG